jgi:hypothetical protein
MSARGKSERQGIDRQLAGARQQTVHWRQVIDHSETFRRLLGDNLDRQSKEPEGAPGHFYRLRLAHLREAQVIKDFSAFIIHS